MTGLQTLDLRSNQITDIKHLLPLLISGLSITNQLAFAGIIIGDNPLSNPPMNIVKKGRQAVINWLEQMAEGKAPLYESKLMILGQPAAGKTTFAQLQVNPKYKVQLNKEKSTLGISIHKGKVFNHQKESNQKIRDHLWDFGGQEIQKMLHQFFIAENCLYIT